MFCHPLVGGDGAFTDVAVVVAVFAIIFCIGSLSLLSGDGGVGIEVEVEVEVEVGIYT